MVREGESWLRQYKKQTLKTELQRIVYEGFSFCVIFFIVTIMMARVSKRKRKL